MRWVNDLTYPFCGNCILTWGNFPQKPHGDWPAGFYRYKVVAKFASKSVFAFCKPSLNGMELLASAACKETTASRDKRKREDVKEEPPHPARRMMAPKAAVKVTNELTFTEELAHEETGEDSDEGIDTISSDDSGSSN